MCWVCGTTEQLEAHHDPVERALTELVDWERFAKDATAGFYGPNARTFDWDHFDQADPYTFVDNMLHNGLLLCKEHHIEKDTGIHMLPYPVWIAQRTAKSGYKFSDAEVIKHVDEI